MTRTATALIIGGGVAGPAAAMALQMVGIESAIYEARPGGAAHVGAFLTLAPNGIDALRVLGADVAVLDAGFPTPGITLRSSTGKRLGETSTGAPLPDGTVGHTLRRSDLYRILCETAAGRGIRVQDGKRLVTATQTGDQVRALFADGSEAVADILIGCDGVNSAVRNVIDPGAPAPAYAGLLTTGGYAPGLDIDSTSGTYEMIFGKQAFFGYVTSPGAEVWWFANVPTPAEPGRGDEPAVTGEAWRPKLLQSYAHDAGPAMALIRATKQIMPLWPVRTLAHLPVWHHGRLAVIGDAAHAPSPSSGQGASLAIEDAVVLAKCLRDLPSPQAAFAHYEAQRRRRVERIVRWAARVNSSKAAGPLASRFRDALLPTILKMTANSKANTEIGSYHVDWEKRTTL